MALDLIFPLSDGGRRSGLDLRKTRITDQAKRSSKRCYLGRETYLFNPSTFFESTLFLRMRGSSLLLTVVSASFHRSAWNIYWASYGPHSAVKRSACSPLTSSSSCGPFSLHPHPPLAHCHCHPSSFSSSTAAPHRNHHWQNHPCRLPSYA